MPKLRPQLRIDARSLNDAAGVATDAADDPAPPAMAAVEAPSGLTLATVLGRSATTPMAIVNATWTPPDGYDTADSTNTLTYLIQWSTDSTFATNVVGAAALTASASIDNLRTGVLYYFRVAAVYRTVQSPYSASASITTALDTTAPGPVTSASASMAGGGDLVVLWTNPASDNLRDVEIKIYDTAGHTTLLATLYNATQRLTWTVAQNLAATSNVGDAALFADLRARSWGGIFSTIVSVSATKAVPSAPTVTLQGYSAVLIAQVTSVPESTYSLFEYVWKRDGSTVHTDLIADTHHTYALGAAGDEGEHSWTVAVRQRDAFGQYSSATTSGAQVLDTLTIGYLRAGLIYTDSVGNTVATLAVLKDGILVAGGVSYAA
jgi:Fibronectin type III domain